MQNSTKTHQMVGLFILLIMFGFASFITTQAYLGMFFIALIVTIMFYPTYKWLIKKLHFEILASFTTVAFFIIILIVPITLIVLIAINQGIALFSDFAKNATAGNGLEETFVNIGEKISSIVSNADENDVREAYLNALKAIVSTLSNATFYVASHGAIMLINFGIFLMFLVFLFPEKERLLNSIKNIMPLSNNESSDFIKKFSAVSNKLSISVIVVPIVQGSLMWLLFVLLGIPGAVFWGVITGIVSLIPAIGVSLIWIPATIIFAIQGNWFDAIAMFLYGLIIMNFSDNVTRAWILKGEKTQIPELVTLLSAIGGLFAFGFFGIFYGPIIVITFISFLEIYRKRLDKQSKNISA